MPGRVELKGGGDMIVYGEANEMHATHDKHHKVSSFLKVPKTHNSVKYEYENNFSDAH